jgi:phosphatidylserine/phosphatidylglycerophosphate/cardiolipin synthase-like enzyme
VSSGDTRVILRTSGAAQHEIRELLASLLAGELISPSERLWLVSPWLRDIRLLDNRSAAFRGVGPGWARRELGLFDVLSELAWRGSKLTVVTRPETGNERALDSLRRIVGTGLAAARLHIDTRPDLHAKGLLGDDYCLSGSMNFTRNGIENLDEMVTYTTNVEQVGALRIEFEQEYGGVA